MSAVEFAMTHTNNLHQSF